jgi:hypothetical protein
MLAADPYRRLPLDGTCPRVAPDLRARDIWSVAPNLPMVTIETTNTRLVWGVAEKQAAWAHAQIT